MKQLALDFAARRALLRVGLPKPGGALVSHARRKGYSVLVSANALVRDAASASEIREWQSIEPPARLSPEQRAQWLRAPAPRTFKGWRRDLGQLTGMDVALDSAGFVAWARYGDFRWTVEAYVELAAQFPWTWWAQMDACCEREIAGSPDIVRLRQAETLRLQGRCESRAAQEGVSAPMPVLQGRNAEDYIWHARRALTGRERLVGLGSVCRRKLYHDGQEDGLVDIVAALDAELGAETKLHLFGVKAEGLAALGTHPRIESTDSMAWDDAARWETGEGESSTMAHRCAVMDRWVEQVERARRDARGKDLAPVVVEPRETPEHLDEWVDLICGDEIELQGALCHI